MGQNGTIFLALIVAFGIFITMRGELPAYMQVFL